MVSANSSKPVSNIGDEANVGRTLIITAVQVDQIPAKKIRKVFVAIRSGTSGKKKVELTGIPLRWDTVPSLQLDTEEIDSVVSFKFYQKRYIFFNNVLGSLERPLKDLLNPNIQELTGLRIALPNGDLMFSVKFENDTWHAAHHLIKSSSEPTLNTAITKVVNGVTAVGTAMGPGTQLSTPFGDLLDSFEPYARLLERISEVHPIAQVAWFVVSSAYKVVKAQYEQDRAICELYIIMMNAYKAASKDDILKTEQEFSSLFDAMIKQSIECSLFISGYSSGGYLRRLTRMNISQKVEQFKSSFQDLEQEFTSAEIRITAAAALQTRQVVSEIQATTSATLLEVRQAVEFANLQATLGLLVPGGYSALSPRASCMPKTRRATLAMIMDWIARGDTSVMWLHGLAGTGKSSVMGSLSDISLELGTNNRRAAFIRFDRVENNDPSLFVRSLAYEMAKFDDRLGKAITESVRRNPGIVQHTQLAKQFSVLILDPLSSKLCAGMKDEGPITVMVDGVDECAKGEMRRQLLALLADGFKGHPFVRLIVSSRPEEDLTQTFEPHLHIRRIALDITSPETKEDISYFITKRLSEMGDDLQEYCKTTDAVSKLSDRASGLFIWAATVLNFIQLFPKTRLPVILETEVPTDALKALTTLYQTALNSIASEAVDEDQDIKSGMRVALGAIMVSPTVLEFQHRDAMRIPVFRKMMADRKILYADDLLHKMGALVAPDGDDILRLLHKSFDDFLTDKARCGDSWYIDMQDHTQDMLSTCLLELLPFFCDVTSLSNLSRDTSPEVPHAYSSWIKCFSSLNVPGRSLPPRILEMLADLFGVYFLRWLMICVTVNPGSNIGGLFVFSNLRAANNMVQPDLTDGIQDLLHYVGSENGQVTLSRKCFQWLCQRPLSNRLRQIYLPAYVAMAGGSTKFSDIMAAIDQNRMPPMGVKDPHEVTILDGPNVAEDSSESESEEEGEEEGESS